MTMRPNPSYSSTVYIILSTSNPEFPTDIFMIYSNIYISCIKLSELIFFLVGFSRLSVVIIGFSSFRSNVLNKNGSYSKFNRSCGFFEHYSNYHLAENKNFVSRVNCICATFIVNVWSITVIIDFQDEPR